MTEGGKGKEAKDKSSWMPSPKKVGEFILDVLQLKRSVESLKKQNEDLRDEVRRLQRQVDEQAGQMKTIQSFIQTSVFEQAARSGERAAIAALLQLRNAQDDT
jgi:chaperonin cofactor prefoldin